MSAMTVKLLRIQLSKGRVQRHREEGPSSSYATNKKQGSNNTFKSMSKNWTTLSDQHCKAKQERQLWLRSADLHPAPCVVHTPCVVAHTSTIPRLRRRLNCTVRLAFQNQNIKKKKKSNKHRKKDLPSKWVNTLYAPKTLMQLHARKRTKIIKANVRNTNMSTAGRGFVAWLAIRKHPGKPVTLPF